MLLRQIRSKSIVPHEIIRAWFTLPLMLVETLFQLVVFINMIHRQSLDMISRQAFKESRLLYESEATSSWYKFFVVSWHFRKWLRH